MVPPVEFYYRHHCFVKFCDINNSRSIPILKLLAAVSTSFVIEMHIWTLFNFVYNNFLPFLSFIKGATHSTCQLIHRKLFHTSVADHIMVAGEYANPIYNPLIFLFIQY